jgi:thiamine-phosphate pyrophosphorylase
LRIETQDRGEAKKIIRKLAPIAQKRGAACLIENDAQLAVHADADGIHTETLGEPLLEALAALQPSRIVGASGLSSRDEAMEAGEAGVDYLMFGGPDCGVPHGGIVERVAWWSEIFNVPCIGYAHDLPSIAELVKVGADFVSLCDCVWNDPRGPAAAVAEAYAALHTMRETVP